MLDDVVRRRLERMADRLERLDDLDQVNVDAARPGCRAPGPTEPPGAGEILAADARDRTLALVETYSAAWCHMLLDDDRLTYVPTLAAAQLRAVAAHVAWFTANEDRRFALDFVDDVAELAAQVAAIAERGTRTVRTPHPCQDPGCDGTLTCPLTDGGDLTCDRCDDVVPFTTWSAWPAARAPVAVR